jgi:hypothetical protein
VEAQAGTPDVQGTEIQVGTVRGFTILIDAGEYLVTKRTSSGEYRAPLAVAVSDGVLALVADTSVPGVVGEIEIAERTQMALVEWAHENGANT